MNKPTAAQLVRSLAKFKGDNTFRRIYNDRIKFGRSIKVCGWKKENYEQAKFLLETHGYTVKIRTIKYDGHQVGYFGRKRKVRRLHITKVV
jgi:hypothetical protein